MVKESDLLEAIRECEKEPITYSSIEKLANLYTVHEYLYGGGNGYSYAPEQPARSVETITTYGGSEFLQLIDGMEVERVWGVFDELMETLQLTNPRLYNGVMRKLEV